MSSLVLKEHQDNMIGSLGVTLLTGKEIARGKVMAAHRILRSLIAGLILGRLLTYGAFVLWSALESGPTGLVGSINPLPLLLSLVDLLLCILVLPRLALAGATASSSALGATFSSYGSVLVSWGIIAMMSTMVTIPIMMEPNWANEITLTLVQRVAKFFLLLIAARIAMENAGEKITRKLRVF